MCENSVDFTLSFSRAQCDKCNKPLGDHWLANERGVRLCDVVCAEAWAADQKARDQHGPDLEEEGED